ncbi:unnamed protein product [Macrosiphum euphorbiae]|uniref:Reverse transcriptase n=1 Tax=Macrosiphum euphorbiae TaxID=13131 RepID=A0AAV0WTR6_9HEMI|nr:unnamed protein product [Macrosiphum euphorbiae]
MVQALTNNGCFQKYLWDRDRAQSPACVHCTAEVDDAEHTTFVCPFWNEARSELSQLLRRQPRLGDVTDLLCRPIPDELPANPIQRQKIQEAVTRMADSFSRMIESIMSCKEDLERRRQGAPAAAVAD